MIKGTLLVSLPIVKGFSVENVQSKNAYFLLSFSDPLEKPLDGYPWNLRTRPSQSVPTFRHIWRQSTFGRFKDYSFNKKKKKNMRRTKQPSVPAYAGTGGCNKNTVRGAVRPVSGFKNRISVNYVGWRLRSELITWLCQSEAVSVTDGSGRHRHTSSTNFARWRLCFASSSLGTTVGHTHQSTVGNRTFVS